MAQAGHISFFYVFEIGTENRVFREQTDHLYSENLKHIDSDAGVQPSSGLIHVEAVKASLQGGRIKYIYPERSIDEKCSSGERGRLEAHAE